MKQYLLLIVLVLGFFSCQRNISGEGKTIDIEAALKSNGELLLSEIASDVQFIALHNLDSATYIQNNVNQYCVGEQVICVVNTNPAEILLFARDGNFIRKIGRRGKGPGEFNSIPVIALNESNKTILIADNLFKKFIVYNYEGVCLKEKPFKNYPDIALMRVGDIALGADGNYLIENEWMQSAVGKCFNLLVLNPQLELVKTSCPGTPASGSNFASLNSQRIQDVHGNVRFWSKNTDTVFSISRDYSSQPLYQFNNPDRLVMDAMGNRALKGNIALEAFLETSNYLLIEGEAARKPFLISYNKKTGVGNQVFARGKCGIPSPQKYGIENDLFGYTPICLGWDVANIYQGKLIQILHPVLIEAIDELLQEKLYDCLTTTKPILPAKRDELVKLIKNMNENSGPILMVMTLK
jgi:hypothetical protein